MKIQVPKMRKYPEGLKCWICGRTPEQIIEQSLQIDKCCFKDRNDGAKRYVQEFLEEICREPITYVEKMGTGFCRICEELIPVIAVHNQQRNNEKAKVVMDEILGEIMKVVREKERGRE